MNKPKSNEISRRDFITVLWGAITALPFLYGTFSFFRPPAKKFRTSLQKSKPGNNGLAEFDINSIPENSSKLINIDDDPVIIIRKNGLEITALSAECTHMNCIVGFRNGNNDIYCSCHGGRFDTDGNILEGPPKMPLKKYNVTVTSNKIIIKSPA